jgi:hypothetical protein
MPLKKPIISAPFAKISLQATLPQFQASQLKSLSPNMQFK